MNHPCYLSPGQDLVDKKKKKKKKRKRHKNIAQTNKQWFVKENINTIMRLEKNYIRVMFLANKPLVPWTLDTGLSSATP
jgi:hypothetical protein